MSENQLSKKFDLHKISDLEPMLILLYKTKALLNISDLSLIFLSVQGNSLKRVAGRGRLYKSYKVLYLSR